MVDERKDWDMWAAIFLVGLLAFIIGVTSVIKPIERLRIKSRKVGAIVMVVGLVAGFVGGFNGWFEYAQEKMANEAGYATAEEYFEAKRAAVKAEKEAAEKEMQDAIAWMRCAEAEKEAACKPFLVKFDVTGYNQCEAEYAVKACGPEPSGETRNKAREIVEKEAEQNPYGVWMAKYRIGMEKCKAEGLDIINDNKEFGVCASAYAGPRPHEQ